MQREKTQLGVRLSAFPKCYLEEICSPEGRTVFDWIREAQQLDADGLEMYDGFLPSFENPDVDRVAEAIAQAGFAMPMLCCSSDFTQRSADDRRREVDRQIRRIEIARRLGGPGTVCRILSGQRRPDVAIGEGTEWVIECISACLPAAAEHQVILGMENHYKDGFWQYPEFAQKAEIFLQIIDAIDPSEPFGVQYDPSNALVAGDDPVELLRRVASRVVSMHASDRYLEPGHDLESLRQSDGTLGYSPHLKHGVTGEGLNDYDAIFSLLEQHQYHGWISIEDGVNGMDEMARSLAFLKSMVQRYGLAAR